MANQNISEFRIDVEGLAVLRKALLELDKSLVRAMDKKVKEVDNSLLPKVRESFPTGFEENFMSGWSKPSGRLQYVKPAIDKTTKITQGRRSRKSEFKVLKQISQDTAGGTMFDRVGRKNAPKSERGAQFIQNLVANFGGFKYRYGTRAIWRGFSLWGGFEKYNEAILKEYETVVKEFENRANKNG